MKIKEFDFMKLSKLINVINIPCADIKSIEFKDNDYILNLSISLNEFNRLHNYFNSSELDEFRSVLDNYFSNRESR